MAVPLSPTVTVANNSLEEPILEIVPNESQNEPPLTVLPLSPTIIVEKSSLKVQNVAAVSNQLRKLSTGPAQQPPLTRRQKKRLKKTLKATKQNIRWKYTGRKFNETSKFPDTLEPYPIFKQRSAATSTMGAYSAGEDLSTNVGPKFQTNDSKVASDHKEDHNPPPVRSGMEDPNIEFSQTPPTVGDRPDKIAVPSLTTGLPQVGGVAPVMEQEYTGSAEIAQGHTSIPVTYPLGMKGRSSIIEGNLDRELNNNPLVNNEGLGLKQQSNSDNVIDRHLISFALHSNLMGQRG
ncbi:hypothetical protein NDU88_001407 [Pleurodeles waltl]|uniref:Uncharacterized protein n=1 Tax=Pleurodeles waltl TaxID=8319 RepID=A0AAV7P734_PLEWA|nr:hypothetical protein NDU88_001407 [Pleurodeles waltl]